MVGRVPVFDLYFDNSSISEDLFFFKKEIDQNIEKIKNSAVSELGETITWLLEALQAHPIRDKEVLILGSTTPDYESIVLAYGGIPTTIVKKIDYN